MYQYSKSLTVSFTTRRNSRNNSTQQCTLQHTHNTHSIKSTLSNKSGLRSFEKAFPNRTAIISLSYFQITLKASRNHHNAMQQIRKYLFKQINYIGREQWQFVAPELKLGQSAMQPAEDDGRSSLRGSGQEDRAHSPTETDHRQCSLTTASHHRG